MSNRTPVKHLLYGPYFNIKFGWENAVMTVGFSKLKVVRA
jgi:hypothetical protein